MIWKKPRFDWIFGGITGDFFCYYQQGKHRSKVCARQTKAGMGQGVCRPLPSPARLPESLVFAGFFGLKKKRKIFAPNKMDRGCPRRLRRSEASTAKPKPLDVATSRQAAEGKNR
jgi:hypothetical protein